MNKKGFTLTEILIVLVVAGILLALILPNTLKAIQRGEVTALRSDLNTIQVALFMCFTENKSWDSCDALTELSDGEFVDSELTTRPVTENPFGVTYNVEDDPDSETGGQVSCYSGGDNLPDDVSSDTSLNECAGGGGGGG